MQLLEVRGFENSGLKNLDNDQMAKLQLNLDR